MNSLVKSKYQKIIETFIDLGGFELFFDLNKKKFKPIAFSNDEQSLKNVIEQKIKEIPYKFKKSKLIRIKLLRYPNNIIRPIGILAMVYNINDNNELSRANENRQQGFWYSAKDLSNRKFTIKDIKLICYVVYNDLVDMSPFKIYYVSEIFKIFKN